MKIESGKGDIIMIRFNCDYSEGAHERILNKLMETNLEQTPGYGKTPIVRRLPRSSGSFVKRKMPASTFWWAEPRLMPQ